MNLLSRLQRSKAMDDSQLSFEKELARESLLSEKLRVTLLAIIFGVAPPLYVLISIVFSKEVGEIFRGTQSPYFAVALAGLIYELIANVIIRYFIRTGRQVPRWAEYGNALIEVSAPTVLILLTAEILHPVYALVSSASLAYFLFVMLSTLRLKFWLPVFTGAVAAVEYLILALLFTSQPESISVDPILGTLPAHVAKSIIYVAGGLVAGFVALQIRKQVTNSLHTVSDRNRIISIFGQHVSPAVVDKLLTQKVEVEGEIRHVCLMFLDIRDFTSFAEKRHPHEVVQYLNELFEIMIDCINRHRGIVNKFLGDGFMAVFGAPLSDGQDIQNAVAAAMEITAKLDELNRSGQIPHTRIGIGLHAGEAVTGTVGAATRKEYTIIGDTVNLAARLEQLNKQFGSQVLISEAVWKAMGQNGNQHQAVALGHVPVRGHEREVQVYKLA